MEKNIEEMFGTKRSNALIYGSYKTKDPYDELHSEIFEDRNNRATPREFLAGRY
jgi:hypothetical protein